MLLPYEFVQIERTHALGKRDRGAALPLWLRGIEKVHKLDLITILGRSTLRSTKGRAHGERGAPISLDLRECYPHTDMNEAGC